MTVRAVEIDPAAAVPAVDLAASFSVEVRKVVYRLTTEARYDSIEFALSDHEGALKRECACVIGEIEGHSVSGLESD